MKSHNSLAIAIQNLAVRLVCKRISACHNAVGEEAHDMILEEMNDCRNVYVRRSLAGGGGGTPTAFAIDTLFVGWNTYIDNGGIHILPQYESYKIN